MITILLWTVLIFAGVALFIRLLPLVVVLLCWAIPLAGAVLFTLLLGQAGCYETRPQHCARVPADCGMRAHQAQR